MRKACVRDREKVLFDELTPAENEDHDISYHYDETLE
jgi:hypothetical protein